MCKVEENSNNKTKIKVVSEPEIVVHGTIDKPYFEIKYFEAGSNEYNIGFGSYDIKNCFKWLKDEFEVINDSVFDVIYEIVIVFGIDNAIIFCRLNAWKYGAFAEYRNKSKVDMTESAQYLEIAYVLQQIRKENAELNGYEACKFLKEWKRSKRWVL